MMIDSSALVAILPDEPEAERLVMAIGASFARRLPASCLLETSMILLRKKATEGVRDLNRFVARSRIEILPFNESQARIALAAFEKFGKGRHPAQLNFGDCMAYAAAKTTGEELLFKGSDFIQTDIAIAAY
jgi:ribonuclease VapC